METVEENREEIIKFIDAANDKLWKLRGGGGFDYDPIQMVKEAYEKSVAINYPLGIAQSTLSKGMGAFIIEHNVPEAFKLLDEALAIFKELDNKRWTANTLLTIAILTASSGKPETAMYHALKGIEYYNNNKENEQDVIMAYYVIGTVFKDLKKYDEAEQYYNIAVKHKTADSSWIGRVYTSLSNIHTVRGEYEKALDLALKSLDILQAEQNNMGVSRALSDIGGIYRKLKQYDKALEYFFRALKIRDEAALKHFVLGSLLEIAATYIETGNHAEAIKFLLRGEPLAVETGHHGRLVSVYQELAQQYKIAGNLKESINYYEKFIELTTQINLKEREAKIDNLQSAVVQEKEQEIERLRNVELKHAHALITEKNKEITDSIHYARRIQKTLLAPDDLLQKNLPEYFVLYKPKDIVSGDFYWGAGAVSGSALQVNGPAGANKENETLKKECFYLAVCDCTGHGVPGAFMSLLNITFLNEAINEKNIYEPHHILNHVRERLINAVSQDGGKDGMDGTLICFQPPSQLESGGGMRLTYSSANNTPLLISKGSASHLPADKMPVGKGERNDSFTLHAPDIKKGDMLYFYTDGYADQFGGPKGKKFKYKKLDELLLNISDQPLKNQSETLDKTFEEWRGELEQVDDVLVIGIKF